MIPALTTPAAQASPVYQPQGVMNAEAAVPSYQTQPPYTDSFSYAFGTFCAPLYTDQTFRGLCSAVIHTCCQHSLLCHTSTDLSQVSIRPPLISIRCYLD